MGMFSSIVVLKKKGKNHCSELYSKTHFTLYNKHLSVEKANKNDMEFLWSA